MFFNSIRWRLQVWHGLILVAVLTGFGFTAYHLAWNNQLRRIDQDLEQQFMVLLRPDRDARHNGPPQDRDSENPEGPAVRGEPGAPGGPRGEHPEQQREFLGHLRTAIEKAQWLNSEATNSTYFILWSEKGDLVAFTPGAPKDAPMPILPVASSPPERQAIGSFYRTRGEQRENYRPLPQGACVLVGRSMATDLAAMRRFALWLFAAGAGILVVGLAGGWLLASRAIRPIDDISATALKIAAGDLSQRINAADAENELGRLAGVLNATFSRLEASFAHQARFTADASHELRTPISVILSQSQTALSRDREAGEYKEALQACQRAAQRMRLLAESLLALARLDAGQDPMRQERFDLARVAGDCTEMIRPLAAERGIELHCDLVKTDCVGDSGRIGQVVTNLLSNAIHFNRDAGKVTLLVGLENGVPVLTVSDTGDGIPAEDLPHIFERFYRSDKSRARRQGRNGLGLAICKAIMDAHSGVIEVSSTPGQGSKFLVRFAAVIEK